MKKTKMTAIMVLSLALVMCLPELAEADPMGTAGKSLKLEPIGEESLKN